MEHKTGVSWATKADDQGVVETIFAVFGNVDEGGDLIHPGAFAKTFQERGLKVKVLDHHQADSVLRVIGKPVALRELSKADLPVELKLKHPEATGAAWAKVQFLMDTPEGKGAFTRIRDGAVDEWSFGYDTLDADYSHVQQDGKDLTVRNLRTVKLYELSPVIWGMNRATQTLSAKAEESTDKNDYQSSTEEKMELKPEPEAGESEDDYMGRCVPMMLDEGKPQDQAVAICMDMFERGGKSEDKTSEVGKTSEVKSGRVLAKRNVERLQRAWAEIMGVFSDAGIELETADEADEQGEKAQSSPEAAGPALPPTALRELELLAVKQNQLELGG